MCKPNEAQLGFVYRDAREVVLTETLVDKEGGFVDLIQLGQEERYIRTEDGSFEEVRFDYNAPPGECPWKTTGRKVKPPLELQEAGRLVNVSLS